MTITTLQVGEDSAVRDANHLDDGVTRATGILRRGGLVAFPTETVYGLGVDATNPEALRRLYAVKGRPRSHPVIVHVGAAAAVDELTTGVPDAAYELARECWPGPLTLVLRRSAKVPDEVTGGRDTVGVRVPDHPLALQLLRGFGGGLAAPSANRFGRVSPTTAADVRADLGDDVDMVLDGGPCSVGVESTIVDFTGDHPVILRRGGIGGEQLEEILRRPVPVDPGASGAPGTLPSHYAPRAEVKIVDELDVTDHAKRLLEAGMRVGILATHPVRDLPDGVIQLDPPGDTREYARVLYSRLRDADRFGIEVLLAVPAHHGGIGDAVRDRLRRAAGAPS
jgi:L-threonylcarbamoyladenylate synthase